MTRLELGPPSIQRKEGPAPEGYPSGAGPLRVDHGRPRDRMAGRPVREGDILARGGLVPRHVDRGQLRLLAAGTGVRWAPGSVRRLRGTGYAISCPPERSPAGVRPGSSDCQVTPDSSCHRKVRNCSTPPRVTGQRCRSGMPIRQWIARLCCSVSARIARP